jgi:hypothetical protein
MNTRKFVVLTLAFLIVLMQFNLAIVSSNVLQMQSYDLSDRNTVYSKIDKLSAPINVELDISGTPSLGQTVYLSLAVTLHTDAPNTTVQILLPDEFVLVAGDLFWNGDLAKNETILLNASVKAVKRGDSIIKASAISEGRWSFGKSDSLYISVFETTATVSDKVPIKDSKLSRKVTQLNASQVLIQEIADVEGIIPSPSNITEVNLRTMPNFTVKNQSSDNLFSTQQNATGGARGTVTILSEDFEGSFPSGNDWTVGDSNSDNGLDYWDDTSYRAWGGDWSGWCADIGVQTNEVVVFNEDFEGSFPGDNWQVGDSEPESGYDYWGDTSHRSYGGSWSCYCADISDVPGYEYDNMMYAYMIRAADASDWDSATLSYYTWYETEEDYDYLRVIVTGDGGAHWYEIGDKLDGSSSGWDYHSVSIPAQYLTSDFGIGFLFYSDYSYTYEGAYVDDVSLTATITSSNWVLHQYDDDMEAYMQKQIDLTGYTSASLTYDYWLDVEDGYDYLKVQTSTDGSNWNNEKVYSEGYDSKDGDPYARTWYYDSVDLSAYTGSSVYIRFLFDSDGSVHDREGAYLDDIKVEAEVGTITVIGYLDYEDYEGNWAPARWATAYIYDDDYLSGDDLLDTTVVQPDGYFESDSINNYDPEGGTQDVYVRFVASNSENGVVNAEENVYDGYTGVKENVPDGVVDFGYLGTPDGEHGAWEIFDTLNTGWSYFINTLSYDHGYVTCIWYPGSTDGTYVEGENGYRMHVIDGDQMDEDVILHEYGHSVMFGIFGEFPPDSGGPHSWTGHYTPELAWSEGWATYASCMIQNDRYYDDTVDQWVHIDVENQTDGSEWDGDGNGDDTESAVCGLLWDIFDTNSDNNDTLSNGPYDTFDVFRYYVTGNHHIYDIHQFWDGWFNCPDCSITNHGHLSQINAIYYDHGINKNNPPSCTIISPNGGGWYSGIVTVEADASDLDGTVSQVEFQYYDWTWHYIGTDTSPSGGWSVDWDTGTLTDSTVWVRAKARDNLGEESGWDESDDSFGVDNTDPPKPIISSLTHPDEGEWYCDRSPIFTWTTPSDISGIACYSYALDHSHWTTPDETCDTTGNSKSYYNLDDGTWYFHVRAKDNASTCGIPLAYLYIKSFY